MTLRLKKKPALTENRSLNRFKWVTCFSFKLHRKHECNLKSFVTFFLFLKLTLYTYSEEVEYIGSRMDEWELTKVRTQGIKKKKRSQYGLTAVGYGVLVFWSRFWVFRPFQVCSQTNKKKPPPFFFWCVKGNDTGMKLLLLFVKSQQSSINKFWKLIRMPLLFFWQQKSEWICWFAYIIKQNRQKSGFLEVKWMFNGKKKVKWFVYFDWRKRCVAQKKFLSYFFLFTHLSLVIIFFFVPFEFFCHLNLSI